ncbi:MAG: flagellar biosynthesis protein FlhF [Nitrosomonas sp.]|nr:flagellar biosynthesis protein FlhF [Nitrosomonas sp.]
MNVKKYIAASSREALRQVKNELGEDAVILSNRQTVNGVEIMALANTDISNLAANPEQSGKIYKAEKTDAVHSQLQINNNEEQRVNYAVKSQIPERWVHDIINEIKAMRSTMENQLATAAWSSFAQRNPVKTKLLRTLLRAGFSPTLSRRLVDKLPDSQGYEQSMKKAMSALIFNLQTVASDEIIDNGGIYALIGPTGVGKTTTTAKIAARSVMRHGADKVALLTTDSYRIGGHEQLRIYGKLLGIPVRTIKDTEDLQLTLSELKNKHMVLIDTVGMSQRDQMVAEQVAMLCDSGTDVKRLLLISATGNGSTLDEVITAYQSKGIYGCIITKIDEAASLGVALDVVIRRKLILHYIANGQKVPEDLHSANPRYLLHRTFDPTSNDSPFSLQDAEFALVMAGSDSPASDFCEAYAGIVHD